jgi:hypothetical protein
VSDTYTDLLSHFGKVLEGLEVGVHDDGGVDVLLKEALDGGEDLSSEDDDGGGSVTDFLILSTGELNHGLGSGMGHVDLISKTQLEFSRNLI